MLGRRVGTVSSPCTARAGTAMRGEPAQRRTGGRHSWRMAKDRESDPMWDLGVNPLELVARTAVIYVLFFAALRLSGKREIGQFTLFDLAMVLLVANALQPAMTGADQSVPGGAIILATIFLLNRLVAVARVRVPLIRRILEFKATTIGRDGQ